MSVANFSNTPLRTWSLDLGGMDGGLEGAK